MNTTEYPQQHPIGTFLALQIQHHDSQAQKHGIELRRQLSRYADELAASVVCKALHHAGIQDSVLANRAQDLVRRLTAFEALVKARAWTNALIVEGFEIKRACDA